MALQKNQIVQTALNLLDRDGLEGVTLRRLATELNIKAASIYWHIPSKEILLDEMANAILEAHFAAFDFENDQRDWAEWLDTLAHELRKAMLTRREGARVVAGAHPDVAVLRLWDMTLRVLHHNGFSYRAAATIIVTLINFTFGSVIEEQSSPPLSPPPARYMESAASALTSFPALEAVMDEWAEDDNDRRFDAGVRIIINGVRAEER